MEWQGSMVKVAVFGGKHDSTAGKIAVLTLNSSYRDILVSYSAQHVLQTTSRLIAPEDTGCREKSWEGPHT